MWSYFQEKKEKKIDGVFKEDNSEYLTTYYLWVPVSSISKISDGCIRDLGFNSRLHQKLIGVLVWW